MLTNEEKARALGGGVFADLPEEARLAMAARMGEREFADGETLFLEGEPGEEAYIVVEGAIEIHHDETVLATLRPGDLFGEMAVLGAGVRTASGRARGRTRVLFLRDRALSVLFQEVPALPFAVCRVLAERLEKVNELALFLAGEREEFGVVEILSGEAAGSRLPIRRRDAILGRRLGSLVEDGLRLALPTGDPDVAARHARLTLTEAGFGIEPLDGAVSVGGETVEAPVLLDSDDEVALASLRLRIRAGMPPQTGGSP